MEGIEGRERFKRFIQERITVLFEEVLNYTEVAVPNKYTYDKIRSRVLTAGNNAIRDLQRECQNFEIRYIPRVSEFVEIDREGDE